MQVSLPALKAFEAAARLGSFKRAAEELSLTPTAVSHHITNLEQRLGTTLFVRRARQIALTDNGKVLSSAATQGFATIAIALETVVASEKDINIATTSSFAALVLIPALQQFYTEHPEIKVNITSGENIEASKFTLPIRLGDIDKQIPSDMLKRERFNLFCGPNAELDFSHRRQLSIYTTEWKNSALPKVPLQEWILANNLDHQQLSVKYFDQELFGIQQALLENAYVFCSQTLAQNYLASGVLSEAHTTAVNSSLCYYIANKEALTSRHNVKFIEWLESVLEVR
ncbi:LysR family transcriptional regulator [Alteromonas sp. KC3]|uniref:LysR family transcriptional regulator n=1 Tax=unclassified Alteromonas TaxID=2614992 RepID=UPI001921B96E|nr:MULTISPECIES: LysR family transcriptional regulator [unclassified Alteromonas]BCO18262.1 LysR family transcriptional regulator [Alteromonas sp. KC3]BCO22222.1 LysR family transcriptional regulator [Alteromonas sp. KC14]